MLCGTAGSSLVLRVGEPQCCVIALAASKKWVPFRGWMPVAYANRLGKKRTNFLKMCLLEKLSSALWVI